MGSPQPARKSEALEEVGRRTLEAAAERQAAQVAPDHSSSDIRMCWLTQCHGATREKAEAILTRPGSRYVPTGVVMRDQDSGQLVVVEFGRVMTLTRPAADQLMGYHLPVGDSSTSS